MWIPFLTVFLKETRRFMRIWMHTILEPVLTGFLYLVIFGEALSRHLPLYEGVSYIDFIIPGLIMMSVLQNAFANTASSVIQAKISGSLVFMLTPQIPGRVLGMAFLLSSALRAILVGAGLYAVCLYWAAPPVREPLLLVLFGLSGVLMMAAFGLITALWAEKYDQMGAVQNFVIMPLTFLSGVFYSTNSLPPVWQKISELNPFFYLADGFRAGFFGARGPEIYWSLAIVLGATLLSVWVALTLLGRGWKIRA